MWKRLIGVFCVVCITFLIMVMRIGSIAADEYYMTVGNQQSTYSIEYDSKRGTIYDTNRTALVNQSETNMAAILVTANNIQEVMDLTGLSSDELQEHMQEGKPFFHEVSASEAEDDNIVIFPVANRYQEQQTAQHLIGYLSEEGAVTGLEKAYDTLLSESEETVRVSYTLDALRGSIGGIKPTLSVKQEQNQGVVLTIDQEIQQICERVGQKLGKGAIVVMDVETGKLRAVCSFPQYSTYTLAEDVQSEDGAMLNRALTATNVGSTFKIAVSAAALEQGISPDLEYECTGNYGFSDVNIRCSKRSGHGDLTMETALMGSCNPWFIHVGLQLQPSKLFALMNSFSFGKGYELAPGFYTAAGTVPAEETLTKGELANLSFGQGELLATPVQVAQMVSCIVNDGVTPTPSLVEGIIDGEGNWEEQQEPPMGIQAISRSTAYRLHSYLVSCVDNEGQNAKPKTVSAGGKTSTAQTGVYQDGEEILNGWFAGFTSAENPNYAIVVVCEDAKSGNKSASPIFAEIADELQKAGKLS